MKKPNIIKEFPRKDVIVLMKLSNETLAKKLNISEPTADYIINLLINDMHISKAISLLPSNTL